MNWYKKAQDFQFQKGQTLHYNYPKVPYKNHCVIDKINSDGTLDVIDFSGRWMHNLPTYHGKIPMFKEMVGNKL